MEYENMTSDNTTTLNETTMFEYSDSFGFDFLEHDDLSDKFRALIRKLLINIGIEYLHEDQLVAYV